MMLDDKNHLFGVLKQQSVDRRFLNSKKIENIAILIEIILSITIVNILFRRTFEGQKRSWRCLSHFCKQS